MKRGIDISEWQGKIDFSKLKGNVDFAIIRLGFITDTYDYVDKRFEEYYKGCIANDIPVGVYVYSYLTKTSLAKKKADWVLSKVKGKKLRLPIYIDLEDNLIVRANNTQIAIDFLDRIEKAGYWAGIYANLYWVINRLDMNKLKRFTLWIAQYYDRCTYNGRYAIWQYTSKGRKPGIAGNVDLNIMYEDIIQKDTKVTKPAEVKPTPVPKPKPQPKSDVITYTIKKGDTLWGIGQKLGVSWKTIYEDNKAVIGNNPDLIYPGRVLKIKKQITFDKYY